MDNHFLKQIHKELKLISIVICVFGGFLVGIAVASAVFIVKEYKQIKQDVQTTYHQEKLELKKVLQNLPDIEDKILILQRRSGKYYINIAEKASEESE